MTRPVIVKDADGNVVGSGVTFGSTSSTDPRPLEVTAHRVGAMPSPQQDAAMRLVRQGMSAYKAAMVSGITPAALTRSIAYKAWRDGESTRNAAGALEMYDRLIADASTLAQRVKVMAQVLEAFGPVRVRVVGQDAGQK